MKNNYIKLNYKNPLTSGLVVAIPLLQNSLRVKELISGNFNSFDLDNANSPQIVNGHRRFVGPSNVSAAVLFTDTLVNTIGSGPYTVCAKIRREYGTSIVSVGNFSPSWFVSGNYEAPLAGPAPLQIYHHNNKGASSLNVQTNKTQNVAFVRRTTAVGGTDYYIDNVFAGSTSHGESITDGRIQVSINRPTNVNHHFAGDIDYVFIWKRALTYQELQEFTNNFDEMFESSSADFVGYQSTVPSNQIIDHATTMVDVESADNLVISERVINHTSTDLISENIPSSVIEHKVVKSDTLDIAASEEPNLVLLNNIIKHNTQEVDTENYDNKVIEYKILKQEITNLITESLPSSVIDDSLSLHLTTDVDVDLLSQDLIIGHITSEILLEVMSHSIIEDRVIRHTITEVNVSNLTRGKVTLSDGHATSIMIGVAI